MKTNEFLFEIYSSDGKKFSSPVSELTVKTSNGEIGILKGHYPLVAFLDISIFNATIDNKKIYFAVSGACLNVKENKDFILYYTFETRDELDKNRLLKKKEEAMKRLQILQKDNCADLIEAERSLKKEINRLRLLK